MLRCRTSPADALKNLLTSRSCRARQRLPSTELHAGDIGAVAKLKETLTGDTLGDKAAPIQYPAVKLPEPAITFAIEPKIAGGRG